MYADVFISRIYPA